MSEPASCAAADAPRWYHRLYFAFVLATLSMALPEVLTLNDPIPWAHGAGYVLGYPVYGLHILVLGGLMYRFSRVNLVTLLAYGGLFGLYEGYLIKQLWNPNWGQELTLSVGGVRVLHTLMLVFLVHPLLAFIAPLAFAEVFLTRPGPVRRALPFLRGRRGAAVTCLAFALWAGVIIGGGMGLSGAGRGMMGAAVILVIVLGGLGVVWRLAFHGARFNVQDLLPKKGSLWALAALLAILYAVETPLIRPEAIPRELLPHALVWLLYAFFLVLIAAYGRPRGGGRADSLFYRPLKPAPWWLAAVMAALFLVIAWLHAPFAQPGFGIAAITYVLGGAGIALFLTGALVWAGARRL